MALFGLKKKKEALAPEVPDTNPTEEVLRLRQQGLSNNQIVQSLQRSGYKTHQIFDAMNQADMRSAAPVEMPAQEQASMEPIQAPQPQQELPEAPYPESQPAEAQSPQTEERIEEVAEAIIDEKWQELVKNVNKIVEWKNSMEAKMRSLEEHYASLKEDFEGLHKALFEKMDKYDKNVSNVGTNLQAMEQVFRKVLPTLTANVNELSRVTKGLKGKKTKQD